MDLDEYLLRKNCSPKITAFMVDIDAFLMSLPGVVREFAQSKKLGVLPRDVHYRKGNNSIFFYVRPQKTSLLVEVPVNIENLKCVFVHSLGIKDVSSWFHNQPYISFNVREGTSFDLLKEFLTFLYEEQD